MNQFEKRKLKELEAEVVEKRQEKREKKLADNTKEAVSLNERAYDIMDVNGRPHLVILHYDVDTKQAKVESVQLVNKSIAMPFKNKKKALQTLVRDLYKLEKTEEK